MKCKFCLQPAGFLKSYHDDCRHDVENTVKQIESIVDTHKADETVPKEVKLQIREIASNNLYKNYIESKVFDKTTICRGEVIIHVESMLRISESKNRCKMIETGYRYEKKPTWKETRLLLDESGMIVFTDKAVYLCVKTKIMRYSYSRIVNYGYDTLAFSLKYAYFDVKTASPFPHRFSFTDICKANAGHKEQNIALVLHNLI